MVKESNQRVLSRKSSRRKKKGHPTQKIVSGGKNMLKPSKYNFIANAEPGFYTIVNTFSGAVVRVNKYARERIETIFNSNTVNSEDEDEDIIKLLSDNGFLIPESRSEFELLSEIHTNARRGERALGIGILPTLNCNFDCLYCYEEKVAVDMPQEIQDGIVEYVKKNLPGRKVLYVDWFGGEPLMRLSTVEKLSERLLAVCEENSVQLISTITTNGYLLTETAAQMLLKGGVRNVQVTLDGPPRIHNRRRYLKSGKGTFENIFNNIQKTAHLFDEFCLRVNIDKGNRHAIPELISLLEPIKENVALAFRPVNSPDTPEESPRFCLTTADYLKVEDELTTLAEVKGFRLIIGYAIPGTIYCSAYLTNSFMVDAYGDVHLCPYYLGRRDVRFGQLGADGSLNETGGPQAEWQKYNPLEDDACVRCPTLPLCMGGCLLYLNGAENEERRCIPKHNFIERMEVDATLNKLI